MVVLLLPAAKLSLPLTHCRRHAGAALACPIRACSCSWT